MSIPEIDPAAVAADGLTLAAWAVTQAKRARAVADADGIPPTNLANIAAIGQIGHDAAMAAMAIGEIDWQPTGTAELTAERDRARDIAARLEAEAATAHGQVSAALDLANEVIDSLTGLDATGLSGPASRELDRVMDVARSASDLLGVTRVLLAPGLTTQAKADLAADAAPAPTR